MYGVVQVLGLEYQDSAHLFLGFGIRTIGDGHFAVLEPQCGSVPRGLQRLPANKMPVLPEHVVIGEALVNEGVSLAFGHRFPRLRIRVSKGDVFHRFLPF
jgi:hypothetical protein